MNHILCLCLFITLTMEVIKGSSTEPSHGDTCENVRKQMPSEIKIGSDNSHLNITCSNEGGMVHEFVLEVKCLSGFCANKTHKQNFSLTEICDGNSQSHKFQLKNELYDSTTYSLEVFADNCEKTYPELQTAKAGPKTKLTELSVFCTSKDALGLKWLNPYPQLENFVSSYEIKFGPNNLTSVRPLSCKLWKDYECTILRDLELGSASDLVVRTIINDKNNTGPAGIITVNSTNPNDATYLSSFTIDAWSDNKSVVLKWQILKTCPPKTVNIKLGPTDISPEDSYLDGNNYAIQIKLPGEKADFDVNIEIEGKWKARAKLTIISSNPSPFTDKFLIEICSKNCSIKIPKLSENQGNGKYYLLVATTDMPDKKVSEILRSTKTGVSEENIFAMSKEEKRYYSFEVGAIEDTISSNHFIFLVTKDAADPKVLMKQHVIWTSSISPMLIVASVASVIIIALAACGLFLTYRFYLKKQRISTEEIAIFRNDSHQTPETQKLKYASKNSVYDQYIYTEMVKIEELKQYISNSLTSEDLSFAKQFQRVHSFRPLSDENDSIYQNLPPPPAPTERRVNSVHLTCIQGVSGTIFLISESPQRNTLNDFWWMIWQENINEIVMLSKVDEGEKKKRLKYWPEFLACSSYGRLSVCTKAVTEHPGYTFRKLKITYNEEYREVGHYQCTSWPSHALPSSPEVLVPFMRKLLTVPQTTPILIHSNTGNDRTGVAILADMALRMAAKERQIDFLKILKDLRLQDMSLFNNLCDYVFVHFLVLTCLYGEDFSVPLDGTFSRRVENLSSNESLASMMDVIDEDLKIYQKAISEKQLDVVLSNGSKYDAAVRIGYHSSKKFIVAKQPLAKTVEKFWHLIAESNADTVVSVNEINEEDAKYPMFWSWEHVKNHLTQNSIKLNFMKEIDRGIYKTVQLKTTYKGMNKIVNVIILKIWKRGTYIPSKVEDVIRIWQDLSNISHSSKKEIVVTCFDGCRASGLFVSLCIILEKIEVEKVLDAYSCVKFVRQHNVKFVQELAQVKFLYKAAVAYVRSLSASRNQLSDL